MMVFCKNLEHNKCRMYNRISQIFDKYFVHIFTLHTLFLFAIYILYLLFYRFNFRVYYYNFTLP